MWTWVPGVVLPGTAGGLSHMLGLCLSSNEIPGALTLCPAQRPAPGALEPYTGMTRASHAAAGRDGQRHSWLL